MLEFDGHIQAVVAAGIFTLISGSAYILQGISQMRHHNESEITPR